MIWTRQAVLFAACLAVAGFLLAPGVSVAQTKKKSSGDAPKIPEPVPLVLETDDGVDLHCTFYPSSLGKEAVPVILIHGWEGRRTQLDGLARFLQQDGHAVLVPDLRGHGDSTIRKLPNVDPQEIKADSLNRFDIQMLATADFLRLKRELLTRHNAGELNIECLTLIGIESGSILALNWAALDWTQPNLPTIKLGRDVKALVLVSPVSSFKGLQTRAALANPAVLQRLSVMIVGGANDSKMKAELKRLDNSFKRFHPDPKRMPNESDDDYRMRLLDKKDYYSEHEETTLQGLELITAPDLKVASKILAFIQLRVVARLEAKDIPAWEGERRTKETVPGT